MATKERLETLKQRKAKIEEQLAALEARAKAKEKKEDLRLKLLIGAGMLANSKIDPSTALFVKDILKNSITSANDREFLQRKGWWIEDKEAGETKKSPGQ